MGGWRCTYRNCSVAADGKTHLFHYPVFDKMRCLKWLTNAERLEFLDLKVSQLKNRVICQHHFKDECFMNYKKDKLTFKAVPTENGNINGSIDITDENIRLPPISFEDIDVSETRLLTAREKKANFSIKYADFLTDPIMHSADNIPEEDSDKKPQKTKKDNDFCSFQMWSHKTRDSNTKVETSEITTSHPVSQPLCKSENIDKGISFNIDVDTTRDILNILEATPVIVDNLNGNKQLSEDIVPSSQINLNDNTDALLNNLEITACSEQKITGKNNNKIKILSEKTLTMPLPVVGKFEPVCPMGILNPRKRKVDKEFMIRENSFSSSVKKELPLPELQTSADPREHKSPIKPNLLESKNNAEIISSPNKIQKENMVSYSKSPSARNRVPPERIAAIEEKRTFNKKLRDMIEFCLDDMEENCKTHINVKPKKIQQSKKESSKSPRLKNNAQHKQSEKCTTKSTSENVKKGVDNKREIESTANEKEVTKSAETVIPDYKLSILEAKLSRMESLLLKKVGENTQRIDNLKQTLSKSNDVRKRSIETQTMQDSEIHKKQLFHEISKYLSPNLKSLIYEELFLKGLEPKITYSNVSKKKAGLSPIKRQRRR